MEEKETNIKSSEVISEEDINSENGEKTAKSEYETKDENVETKSDRNELSQNVKNKEEDKGKEIVDNKNSNNEAKFSEEIKQVESREEAEKILKDRGFDYSILQEEFFRSGSISEENRAKLAQAGITEKMIEDYIEGQEARIKVEQNELAKCIGGIDVFNSVVKWAGENLTQDEKISINNINDRNVMKIILKDLKTRMEEKEGIRPEYIKGEGNKAPVNGVFRSQAEMFEAICNPKYKKDEAYRSDVQKKITASRLAGIDLGI